MKIYHIFYNLQVTKYVVNHHFTAVTTTVYLIRFIEQYRIKTEMSYQVFVVASFLESEGMNYSRSVVCYSDALVLAWDHNFAGNVVVTVLDLDSKA